eukprot:2132866-Amphidinium_carterae.2
MLFVVCSAWKESASIYSGGRAVFDRVDHTKGTVVHCYWSSIAIAVGAAEFTEDHYLQGGEHAPVGVFVDPTPGKPMATFVDKYGYGNYIRQQKVKTKMEFGWRSMRAWNAVTSLALKQQGLAILAASKADCVGCCVTWRRKVL